MPAQVEARLAHVVVAVAVMLFSPGCASRQVDAGAASAGPRPMCAGTAELRVINRSNMVLELLEYDRGAKRGRVIGVVEPGISHFPARADGNVIYSLRGLDGRSVAIDRESGDGTYTFERRCR